MPDALNLVSTKVRKQLIATEAKRRKTGEWGEWEKLNFPKGTIGREGWVYEITEAHKNKVFSVLDVYHGDTRHLAVASLTGKRPSWPEMQRIKDEIAGPDKTAVEVYPPHDEVVDEADMFHIWVLPYELPFTISYKGR